MSDDLLVDREVLLRTIWHDGNSLIAVREACTSLHVGRCIKDSNVWSDVYKGTYLLADLFSDPIRGVMRQLVIRHLQNSRFTPRVLEGLRA